MMTLMINDPKYFYKIKLLSPSKPPILYGDLTNDLVFVQDE